MAEILGHEIGQLAKVELIGRYCVRGELSFVGEVSQEVPNRFAPPGQVQETTLSPCLPIQVKNSSCARAASICRLCFLPLTRSGSGSTKPQFEFIG